MEKENKSRCSTHLVLVFEGSQLWLLCVHCDVCGDQAPSYVLYYSACEGGRERERMRVVCESENSRRLLFLRLTTRRPTTRQTKLFWVANLTSFLILVIYLECILWQLAVPKILHYTIACRGFCRASTGHLFRVESVGIVFPLFLWNDVSATFVAYTVKIQITFGIN